MAGSGSRLSTRNSLSSQDAVLRRRRLEDGGIRGAQPAPPRAGPGRRRFRARRIRRDRRIYRGALAIGAGPFRRRAIQRRMVREADDDLADLGQRRAGLGGRAKRPAARACPMVGRGDRQISDRRTLGGRSHGLSVPGPLPATRRPQSGFRQGRRHRAASFRLDRSHAEAPHCRADPAASLEMSAPARLDAAKRRCSNASGGSSSSTMTASRDRQQETSP